MKPCSLTKSSLLFLLFNILSISLYAQPGLSGTKHVLSISDVHFDPFYDTTLVTQLIKSDYRQWPAIFATSKITQPNSYGSDANFPLIRSALAGMRKQNAAPAFIIITGDFLSHHFQASYDQYAPAYPDSVKSFTAKTIRFLAMMVDRYFPETVVLPVLGNNDSYCGDYMVQPYGDFLTMFAKAFVPLQRNHNIAADHVFIRQFAKGGYYTYHLKDGTGGKMVMLNTIFFSSNYSDACGGNKSDPAGTELNWLAGVLKQSHARGTKVWMAYHIMPGIDAYATNKNTSTDCSQRIKTMWRDSCNDIFLKLIIKYATNIKAAFAGHTHMDDFRVVYNDVNKPVSFIHITPAVSPLFHNNPGFQELTYHTANLDLIDLQTYYFDLNSTAPLWKFEYDYGETYGTKRINALTLDQVRQNIANNAAVRNRYTSYYDLSNQKTEVVNAANFNAYWCATGNLTRFGFRACYCGFGKQ